MRHTVAQEWILPGWRPAFWGRLLGDLNDSSAFGRFAPDAALPTEEGILQEQKRTIYRRELQRCVGEWIETGFSKGRAIEEPLRRRLCLSDPEDHFVCTQAYRLMADWLDTHKPRVIVLSSGDLGFERPEQTEHEHPPVHDAVMDAVGFDLLSLMSDKRKWALSKCSSCLHYYIREKLRKFYKRETYCQECRSQATATRRMKEKRETASEMLWNIAVDARSEWKRLSELAKGEFSGDPKRFVVSRVESLGKTKTWVSRHWVVIENRAKEKRA